MSRCHLLVECQASVSRRDSNDKANGGAAVYRWNAALNRWTECHTALLTPLWPTKAHFFSPPEPGQAADGILGASLLSVLLPDAHSPSKSTKKCSACLPSSTSISPAGSNHSSVSSMQTLSFILKVRKEGNLAQQVHHRLGGLHLCDGTIVTSRFCISRGTGARSRASSSSAKSQAITVPPASKAG